MAAADQYKPMKEPVVTLVAVITMFPISLSYTPMLLDLIHIVT